MATSYISKFYLYILLERRMARGGPMKDWTVALLGTWSYFVLQVGHNIFWSKFWACSVWLQHLLLLSLLPLDAWQALLCRPTLVSQLRRQIGCSSKVFLFSPNTNSAGVWSQQWKRLFTTMFLKLTQVCLFVLKTFKRLVSQIVGFCQASLLLHLCLFCLLLSFSIIFILSQLCILIAWHLHTLTSSSFTPALLWSSSHVHLLTTSHLHLCTSCMHICSSSHHPVVASSLFLFYCHARLLFCRVCPGNPALHAVRGEGCGRGIRAGLQGDLHHGWRCILHSILLH